MHGNEYLILPFIAFLAFLVKAVSGFGPAIVVVALGSLFVASRAIIPASAILDMIAGAALLRTDWSRDGMGFWLPLALTIAVGSVAGSVFLKVIPPASFRVVLASAILMLGIWFFLYRGRTDGSDLLHSLPIKPSFSDYGFTLLAGFLGGLLGISGPPIIWHFGRKFSKEVFRRALIPIFLAASIARVVSYTSLGLVDGKVLLYVFFCIPGLLMGIYLGNRIFSSLSEGTFSRVIGWLLVLVAIQLMR